MATAKRSFFLTLVYIAYIYFTGIGGAFIYASIATHRLLSNSGFIGFIIIAIFGIQFYYKNKIINLILGIAGLFLSIWFMLDIIGGYDLMNKSARLDAGGKIMMLFSIVSIIMSGILMFSYMMAGREGTT